MRLLALDIGNTNVTAGLFEDETLRAQFRLRTDTRQTSDEYAALIGSLIALYWDGASLRTIEGVAIASVVPPVTTTLERACRDHIGVAPYIVSSVNTPTGMPIDYDPVSSLGVDRLVNAFAAFHLYGKGEEGGSPSGCIVVDYGTATKLEAVDTQGVYRGGVILPGVGISMDALFERAALLRQIPLAPAPSSAIGGNTADALRAGILLGYGAQTDGLVRRFRDEMGTPQVRVIATGGLADLVAPHAATVDRIDSNLTVVGLRMLFERNRR
jgi:type III pantothenate kinase